MEGFVCYKDYTKLGYCPKDSKVKYSKNQIDKLLSNYREKKSLGLNPCAIVERKNKFTIRRLTTDKIILKERKNSNCWVESSKIQRGLLFQ